MSYGTVMVTKHVMPVGDIIGHEPALDCACQPWFEEQAGDEVYTHNAWDNRMWGEAGNTEWEVAETN